MTLGERVAYIRKEKNLSMEKFGEKISVSKSSICKIESGENNPSERTLRLICSVYGISYSWLTEEIGEMEVDSDYEIMTMIDNLMVGENEFAKKAIKAAARFTDEQWAFLESIVKSLQDDSDQ